MAPSITSGTGSVTDGGSVTLVVTNAGTKSRNTPYFYMDAQGGTLAGNSSYSSVTAFTSTQNRAIVSDAGNARWGNGYVVKASWPRDGTSGGRSSVLEVDVTTMAYGSKLYVNAWRKWTSGDSTGNWKWWRFWPSGGAGNYPDAYIGDSDISDTGNRGWFLENGTPVTGTNRTYFTYPVPGSTWMNDEIMLQLNSSAGATDGTLKVINDLSSLVSDTSFSFDFSGIPGILRKVDFQDTKANADPGASMNAYVADFVVDDSWNRVMLGDASTLGSCTKLEYQPFTAWSDTGITLVLQKKSFASLTGKYLYLYDGSNLVSSGFALSSIGGGLPAPTLTSLSVTSGPAAGGTSTTATGANIVNGATVTVGGASATGVTFNNSTSITFTSPSGTAGAKDVVLTNPDAQTATLEGGFTYVAAPTLTSISPSTVGTAGGATVTATGTGFSGVTGVTVGGTACTGVTTVSSTSVTFVIPAKAAGLYTVSITNGDGQVASLSNSLTYSVPPVAPTITSISPSEGSTVGNLLVTITGTDLLGSTVTFDGVSATGVAVISNTVLTCYTPAHAEGSVNVVVTNQYALSATAENGFSYTTSGGLTGRRRSLAAGRFFG